ncbi:MAG: 3,4-dihydroxyphenylacetate 2,3-dioxygenase [Microbacteriaceae bacterium]|jgi:aromatic ring-opening dioxygenase catalytic subunit (LigB family)|nr:catechol 1,2-dioxygenase [Microbacteriaceae bacterium]MDQ1526807.1 3,4-dihydroxyphenylacetate 2,3-dioxygenase [Microbacteriaceae bacterium]MDQ1549514.1 3,4-dihydroxyphenylacetate 2,3-dioxygenase [Microbacteriaceae bacterium]MDQ1578418.1 3,4-dihydroxyphenylacetate 2,3-dioxygenase [Microbacteriaceae bacterium]
MGEVVGVGLIAHVPTIMLPRDERLAINDGKEITLVPGLEKLRKDVFESDDYDTVVVLDSHWATTVEYVISSHEHRGGKFTSEELPRGMHGVPFGYRGDPQLAELAGRFAEKNGTWITPIDDPDLPVMYATINLWKFLGEGLDKRWVSLSVCQTGTDEDMLRAGRALGEAIAASDRRVILLASGALSHTFYKLRELRKHEASDPKHIFSDKARAADYERLEWMKAGEHGKILESMPAFHTVRPEAMFGHWLLAAGAIGEEDCTAPGELYSEYENSIGTGQVHVWFPRPADGFPLAKDVTLSRD